MNTRTTLFLVVLVALVGSFVVWDHYRGKTTEQLTRAGKRIFDFDAKDITGIELVRSNQTLVFEKSGDDWDIKQPLAVRADAGAVNSILDDLEFAERSRTLNESELKGVSLADFGLESPQYRVTLRGKKQPVGLRVGRETPTKDALYVQVEGRRDVFVTGKTIQDRLNLSLDNLRSRTVIEFMPSSATRLEIKTADRVIELSRVAATTNTAPRWSLTRPLPARADQNKVSELLTDLNGLRIQDFVSEDPKDVHTYALDEPEREVTVFTGEAGKTLIFGRPLTNDASKVYAKLKSGNTICTVSAEGARKFALQINDLRDARVLAFDQPGIAGVTIARGTDKIELRRTDKGWRLTGPVGLPAEDTAVDQLLDDLNNLRSKQFIADVATDLDKYGLATPALAVSLSGEGTNLLAQLLVGSNDASNTVRYVKNTGEPFICGVETAVIDRLPDHYGPLRSRRIFDLKPEQVTKLTAGNVTASRDAQGKWQLVAPVQGALDADSLNHLVNALCQLRADRFGRAKADRDDTLGVTFRATVGNATHWLFVSREGEAAADSCELTFHLPPPVVQTLNKELVAVPAITNQPAVPAPPAP